MKLLVGIPTHKRPELLRECLESIAAQQGELPDIQLFVADNDAKGQEGVRLIEAMRASYRFPLNAAIIAEPGISAVRNAILDEARDQDVDFIAMIDDDVQADPHWLPMLWERARATGADILAGPVSYDFPQGTSDFLRTAFVGDPRPTGSVDLINGTTGVLISTARLKASGWPKFDSAFGLTGGGDKEWFSRLKGIGCRFEWVSEASVVESVPPSRATLKWFLKRRYRYGIDDMRIDRLHGTAATRRALVVQGLGMLALSPIFLPRLFSERRYVWLGRIARGWGRLVGIFGVTFDEYAGRHPRHPTNSVPNGREAG